MKFDAYLFDVEFIRQKVEENIASLKANKDRTDLLEYGLDVVRKRINKSPKRYLDYGPYWWSLKVLLIDHGASYGAETDTRLSAVYCGTSGEATLTAAELFREYYLENFLLYSNKYVLDSKNPGESYILYDNDMEILK